MAGYSGTPLARKLGIRDDHRVVVIDAPTGFGALLDPLPTGATTDDLAVQDLAREPVDIVIAFHTARDVLADALDALGAAIHPERALWLAWPKTKPPKGVDRIPSDLTGDVVRDLVLSTPHLVDVKVCAIDDRWSGLKIVWRTDHR